MTKLSMPPTVEKRFEQLYELIEKHGENGQIPAIKLAKFMQMDITRFRRLIYNGDVPFAFGDSKAARASSYIDIMPLWQYMTQGQPVLINSEGGNKDEDKNEIN